MRPEFAAGIAGLVIGWLAAPGVNKTQGVRLLDVAILGPWLFLLSLNPQPSLSQRAALAFAGGATASYNLRNYLGSR